MSSGKVPYIQSPTIQPYYFNFFASRIIIGFDLEMEPKWKSQLKTELHWKISQSNWVLNIYPPEEKKKALIKTSPKPTNFQSSLLKDSKQQ